MHIQLNNNQVSVVAGQVIKGIIHINLKKVCFDTKHLTIGLHGSEETSFRQKKNNEDNSYTTYRGRFPIINAVFPVERFVDGPPRPGQWSYPFSLQIPDWLPSSMMLPTGKDDALLKIEYHLRAQFTPIRASDWADYNRGISTL